MNYNQIKKLDEETLEKLTEGPGPADECLCSLLGPSDDEKKGLKASIKKALGIDGGRKKYGQNKADLPVNFSKTGKGISSTRELVKRSTTCGKCGCSSEVMMKHSYANIRITTPDIDASSICSCDSGCMANIRSKLQNNVKVTVENVIVVGGPSDGADSEMQNESESRDLSSAKSE